MNDGQFFRAGVGIVVTDGRGHVLALERADLAGAWQFPQGGLEAGEEPLDAALRELWEETGLTAADVELVDQTSDWLPYELPAPYRSAKTGRGQVQRWFLFQTEGGTIVLAPGPAGGSEVRAVAWTSFDTLIDGVVEFRADVYQRVAERFGLGG